MPGGSWIPFWRVGYWPAEAGVMVKKGTFAKAAGADGTTQQVVIGFRAKAIIFWSGNGFQTSEGYDEGMSGMVGFCDGTATAAGNRVMTYTSTDNQAASDTYKHINNTHCLQWTNGVGTIQQQSYVSAIDEASFTLTHDLNTIMGATSAIIHYMAIGGPMITDTTVDSFQLATTTGNQSITSLSFQPDFVLVMSNRSATMGVGGVGAGIFIGVATGPDNEWTTGFADEDARNPTDNWRWQRTDRIQATMQTSTGTAWGQGEFTQFTSNGFDINWLNANDAAHWCFVLAIKGGNPYAGNFLQPTSTGIQTIDTPSIPKAVMMFSGNNIATTSIDSNTRLSIGGTDGISEGTTFNGDTDDVTPTVVVARTVTTKAFGLSTENATPASSTTNAEADFDSFNATNFKLNWTTADATQREILFFMFSEVAAAAGVGGIRPKAFNTQQALILTNQPPFFG